MDLHFAAAPEGSQESPRAPCRGRWRLEASRVWEKGLEIVIVVDVDVDVDVDDAIEQGLAESAAAAPAFSSVALARQF